MKTTTLLKNCAFACVLLLSVNVFSQTSEVIVSVNWPNWSTECKVEIFSPGNATPILTIDNGYDGSSDSSYNPTPSNLGCIADNLTIGAGGYYAKVYEFYGDGWNGGGTLNITSGGVNVLSFDENSVSDANDLDNGSSGEVTQILYFAVTNGGAACSSGPEINITGSGNTILDNDSTPSASDGTNFGSVYYASGSVTRTFTIQNQGSTTLNLTGSPVVSVIGADASNFVVTQPANSVSSGGSITFDVTFDPVSVGTKTVSLSIANNDTTGSENPYNFDITGIGSSVAATAPGNISSDLQLWMKADAGTNTTTNGGSVSSWSDNSPNSFTATTGVSNSPTYQNEVINFNPAIKFNTDRSEKKYLKIPTASVSGTGLDITPSPGSPTVAKRSSMSIFAAFLTDGSGAGTMFSRATSSSRSYQLWLGDRDRVVHYTLGRTSGTSQSDPDSGINYGIVHARNDAKISSVTVDVNASMANDPNEHKILRYVNGYLDPLTVHTDGDAGFGTGETTNMDVLIGARRNSSNTDSGNELIGNVAEIIVYNRALSSTERQKVETYMAIKYGITLGYNDEYYRWENNPNTTTTFGYSGTSNDYMLSNGDSAWDGSDNAGYGYNVFGIARDDNSSLLQLKSKSVHVEEITKDTSVITMEDESGSIDNDRDYLLVGNNGATVQLQSSSVPERVFSTINRVWKSRESNKDIGTVKLDFDLSQYSITGATDLELIVSKNSDLTNYKNYTGTYNASTKIVSFTGVDLDDAEYFTLAKLEELNDSYHFGFDGTQYVDAGDNFDLNSNGFTISAWVKTPDVSGTRAIVSKRDYAYTEGYEMRILGNEIFNIRWKNSSGDDVSLTSSSKITIDKWHHVAVIYNGTTGYIYIDGVLDTQDTMSQPASTSQTFKIGAAGDIPSRYFRGDVDEVRVWDVALTEDQLRFVMNQEIVAGGSATNGTIIPTSITKYDIDDVAWNNLAAYFPFTHVRGNCMFNKSSFGTKNGRLYNIQNSNIETQTAPLPYVSTVAGYWHSASTWVNGSTQDAPGSKSIITGSNETVDWNIVVVNHNITMDNSDLPSAAVGNRSALGLFLNNATLTVRGSNASKSGYGFTVTHYLDMDGDIVLQGESQLIQTEGSDLVVGSTGKLYRDQQGTADKYTYNYWSSPVGDDNIGTNEYQFRLPQVIPGIDYITSGYDGTASPVGVADYWIWKFANNADDDYSAWEHIRSTGNIKAGEGFTMKGPGTGDISDEQNYEFSGKPNNGDIELGITAGNDYLVGNPYASAIDARQFILDNGPTVAGAGNTTGTIYYWEHWGGGSHNLAEYQGGYATYNLIGGVPAVALGMADPDVDQSSLVGTKTPGRYIPVSQGFFVIGEATGTIKFNNGQRLFQKEDATSVFMEADNTTDSDKSNNKSTDTEENVDPRMKLRVALNSNGELHRQLLVGADENATEGVDWGYDGILYDNQTDDIYWMIDDAKYVIQGVNVITEETVLPLGIHTNLDGLNTITLEGLENFADDVEVYLHDKELELYHDLRSGDYEFELVSGTYLERFEITFNNSSPLDVTDNELELFNVTYTNDIESIVIINPTSKEMDSLELFNILGQSVFYTDEITNATHQEIKVTGLSTGAYIIHIDTPEGKVSKKVIIK